MASRIVITRPESDFPELLVHVPSSWPYIQLAPLYDVHIGNNLHATTIFKRHAEWLAREPYTLTFNGGDIIENSILGSPGVFSQNAIPDTQFDNALKVIYPLKDKMLFALSGNHEYRTFRQTGFDLAKHLAQSLGIEYFPDYCFCSIRWRGNTFRIAAHHGTGAAQSPGGQRNAARKDAPWLEADIYWCFPSGTPILMADGTTKPIETLGVGDRVISGSGRVVPIQGLTQQPFSGDLVSMRPLGWPAILATPNHPMSVLRRYSTTQWKNGFHRADALVFKDALKRVSFTEEEVIPDILPSRMRLYGYYLAEGSIWESDEKTSDGVPLRMQLSFCFSTDERETLVKDCKGLLADMGYEGHENVDETHHSIVVRTSCKEAVAHFKTLFGKGAANKAIPEIFLRYPKEHIRELLSGLYLGDGHSKRQGLELTTVSKSIAEQATFLLSARLNEPASFSYRDRQGKQRSYVVFRGHSEGQGSKRKYTSYLGAWFSPLRKVERQPFSGPVYCLHIGDPDPTFVVGQFVVHNTGHLHQPMVDLVYRVDNDQETGRMFTRQSFAIVSPSYLKFFGGYGAAKRFAPGAIGLVAVTLQSDGRMDSTLHSKGRRL